MIPLVRGRKPGINCIFIPVMVRGAPQWAFAISNWQSLNTNVVLILNLAIR